jgi:hypothetical protein
MLPLNRRRWLQGLGLAGSGLALPASATPPRRGTTLARLAQQCAHQLERRLGERVGLQLMPPGTDTRAWCSAWRSAAYRRDTTATGLLLTEAWRLGAEPQWHSSDTSTAACLAAAPPLAVLAHAPLVLAANRFMPLTLAAFGAAAPADVKAAADASAWRYGLDGSDRIEGELIARCLQAAGLGRLQALAFRGPSQLLPALAGARLQLTVQPIAGAGPACSIGHERVAGNQGSWAAAHRAGDVHLLAVADEVRLGFLPEVPTLKQALGEAGLAAARCRVLLATPGGSPQRLRRLADAAASLAGSC